MIPSSMTLRWEMAELLFLKRTANTIKIPSLRESNLRRNSNILNQICTVTAKHCPPRFTIRENQYQAFSNRMNGKIVQTGEFKATLTYWEEAVTY